MKITDVKVTVIKSKSWVKADHIGHVHPCPGKDASISMLSIETDEGITGYSFSAETYLTGKPGIEIPDTAVSQSLKDVSAAAVVKSTNLNREMLLTKVRPVIIGEDPLCREKIFHMLYKMQRSQNNAGLTDAVINQVDKALWDLFGRMTGLPVYKLLGGHRTKVIAYASTMVGDHFKGGLSTPDEYAAFAKQCVAEGYKAIKLHTWADDDWSGDHCIGKPDYKKDIEACIAVREAVGPDIELMLDCFHYYDRYEALAIGKAIQDLNFLWFEEPMEEYNVSSYKWLRSKLDIPIIGPEVANGKYWTRAEWIANGACDIPRGGGGSVGGITSMMKMMHTCESFGVPFELHGVGSQNLHVMAAMTIPGKYYERGMLHPFLEYNNTPPWLNAPIDPMDSEGYVAVPQLPGLGYDINWDYIKENTITV